MYIEDIPLRISGKKWKVKLAIKLLLVIGKLFGVNFSIIIQTSEGPFISTWEKNMRQRAIDNLVNMMKDFSNEKGGSNGNS